MGQHSVERADQLICKTPPSDKERSVDEPRPRHKHEQGLPGRVRRVRPPLPSKPDPLALLRLTSPDIAEAPSSSQAEVSRILLQRVLDAHHSPDSALRIEERARYALSKACNGWRRNRICRDSAGRELESPHPGCVRAQVEHDTLLGKSQNPG